MQGIGSLISALGEGPDTEAIHLTKGELKKVQKTLGQKGKRNPLTGLLGFWGGSIGGDEGDQAEEAAEAQEAAEDAMDQADEDMGDSYGSNVGEGGYTGPGSPAAAAMGDSYGMSIADEMTAIDELGWTNTPFGGGYVGGIGDLSTQTDEELDAWNKAQFQEFDEFGIPDSTAAHKAGMNELGNFPMSFWDEVEERGFFSTLLNHLIGILPGVNVQAYHNDPGRTQDQTTFGIGELIGDLTSLATGGFGYGIGGMFLDEHLSRPTTSEEFRDMTAAREAGKSYGTRIDLDWDNKNPPPSLAELVGLDQLPLDKDEAKLASLESPKQDKPHTFGDPPEYQDSDSDSDNKLRRTLRIAQVLDKEANIDSEPEVPSNIDSDMVDLISDNRDRENWYNRYQGPRGEPVFGETEFAGPAYYEEVA
jgi:hypothetical protein